MSKKLTDNGLWESSRMMLPEHTIALIEMGKQDKRRAKPNVDFEAIEEISEAIGRSYATKEPISLEVYNEYAERIETGIVERVDQYGKRIYMAGEWIKFDEIIAVK